MNALKINVSGIIGSQAIIEILGKGSETRDESKGYNPMIIKFSTSAGHCQHYGCWPKI